MWYLLSGYCSEPPVVTPTLGGKSGWLEDAPGRDSRIAGCVGFVPFVYWCDFYLYTVYYVGNWVTVAMQNLAQFILL